MGPHCHYNQTFRGEIDPKKLSNVTALAQKTREYYHEGYPFIDHKQSGVVLLDFSQLFITSSYIKDKIKGDQPRTGVQIFHSIWRHVKEAFNQDKDKKINSDNIHTVVLATDDQSRVPVFKQKEQKKRRDAADAQPYAAKITEITEDGVLTEGSDVPVLIDVRRLRATRGGMRNLCSFFDKMIARTPLPDGKTVIFDFHSSGPIKYQHGQKRRIMTECIHPFGEADMSMIFWTKHFKDSDLVIVRSIDADTIPTFGWYISQFPNECPDNIYWTFKVKKVGYVSVELHRLVDAITQAFGYFHHFLACIILTGTDFHEKNAFAYFLNVQKTIDIFVQKKDGLKQQTELFVSGDLPIDEYLGAFVRVLDNEKKHMCMECLDQKRTLCFSDAKKLPNDTATNKHSCGGCASITSNHTCFQLTTVKQNWEYWTHVWSTDTSTPMVEVVRVNTKTPYYHAFLARKARAAKKKKKEAEEKKQTALTFDPSEQKALTAPPPKKKKKSTKPKKRARSKKKKKPASKNRKKTRFSETNDEMVDRWMKEENMLMEHEIELKTVIF